MKIRIWLLALLLTIGLVGCGTPATEEGTEVSDELGVEEQGVFPVIVTDALGNEMTIEEEPERIVSLIPSVTETLFAIGQGDALVGRTDFCNYPVEVTDVQSVGGLEFDVEQVIALQPDLVLGHASNASSYEGGFDQIRQAGIEVFIVNDASQIEDVYTAIESIGQVTGGLEEAVDVVEEMKEGFAALEEKASSIQEEDRVRVWVEVSPAPDIYTTGRGTFLDELLTLINADNVASDVEGWVPFSEEEAVAFQPDVIVTTYGSYMEGSTQDVLNRQGWTSVPAIEQERVYDVDSDEVTRSGPRLVKGAEELATSIYPEVFGQ